MASNPPSSSGAPPKDNEIREKALIKIIVLGCANVGKTSIMERFARGKFSGIRRPTVGADFMTKKMLIHDIEVNLQVWDTAGQERFHTNSIGSSFYRGAHGALLVYDVNNEKSQEQVEMWRDECISRKESDDYFPIVVVGNKIDIRDALPENERTNTAQITSWCRENGYGHIETSAKDGHGIEAAMIAVVGLALDSQRTAARSNTSKKAANNDKVELNKLYEPKKSGMCGCTK